MGAPTDVIGTLLMEGTKARRKGHNVLADACEGGADLLGLQRYEIEKLRSSINQVLPQIQASRDACLVKMEEMRAALLRIAFPDEPDEGQEAVSDVASNPGRWTSTIAYEALGGRVEDGVRIDDKEKLR